MFTTTKLIYLPIAHMTNSLSFDDNVNLSLLNSDNIVFQPIATLKETINYNLQYSVYYLNKIKIIELIIMDIY